MSLETWKEEFYSEQAEVAAIRGELAATEHCIKKWAGASSEALEAHGTVKVGMRTYIQETDAVEGNDRTKAFWFDTESCALCRLIDDDGEINCTDCIICIATGKVCDDGAYADWHMNGDPTAMQNLLAITREYLLGRQDGDAE